MTTNKQMDDLIEKLLKDTLDEPRLKLINLIIESIPEEPSIPE